MTRHCLWGAALCAICGAEAVEAEARLSAAYDAAGPLDDEGAEDELGTLRKAALNYRGEP